MVATRIVEIKLHYDYCAAHGCCVVACPEVFVLKDGCVSLTSDATQYFDSHVLNILRGEAYCPVDAIEVHTDPPRPARPERPRLPEYEGRTVIQMLEEARGQSLKNLSAESLAKLRVYYELEIEFLSHPTYWGRDLLASARAFLQEICDELASRAG